MFESAQSGAVSLRWCWDRDSRHWEVMGIGMHILGEDGAVISYPKSHGLCQTALFSQSQKRAVTFDNSI